MSWPIFKLGDLVTIKGGGTPSKKVEEYWNGDIPWASVKDLKGNEISSTADFITEAGVKNSATKLIPAGTILTATRMALGRFVVTSVDIAINQDLKALFINDSSVVERNYLIKFLSSKAKYIEGEGKGATVKGITLGFLKELQIPLPPLEEQKRIAAILDIADNVRRKRQQAIDLADDFLRSVFLDMFGDPVTNPKSFPLSILSDFYIDHKNGTKCGPFGSALKKHEYVEDGVPVWNMDNISLNGKFTDSPRLWITESKYVDLEAYSVQDGDVIISRAGTVGKLGVVRSKSEHSIISTNLIRVRLGEKLRPEYFVNLMNYCKGRVGRLKTGPDGAFTHMNTGILDKLEFPYPPIELQDKFMEIKEKVISSMEKSEKNEIENLFNSLSQKAFAGEL